LDSARHHKGAVVDARRSGAHDGARQCGTSDEDGAMRAHQLASEIASVVADRDLDALADYLSEDVRLRALLPGGPEETTGRAEVLGRFKTWFGDYAEVVLDESAGDDVGDRLLVHYRLVLDPDVEPHVVSQTWSCTYDLDGSGRLARIDLLCSGFRKF
jgi:ketosteroid isomerase-like protein